MNSLLRMPMKGKPPNGSVCAIAGLARPTIYRDIKRGTFPRPVKIGAVSAWPAREIEAINAARIAGKSEAEIKALVAALEANRRAP